MEHHYSIETSLAVIAILTAGFLFFWYYPFKKKKVKDSHPSATVFRLDDFENKISE